jgi:hypothetical protein
MPPGAPSDAMPIDPIQPASPAAAPAAPGSGATPAAPGFAGALSAAGRQQPPAGAEPPPDALSAVEAASRRYEEMRERGRQLQFEADAGRIRIEVYDGNGKLVREIPPTALMALAAGEASWQA